MAGDWIKMTVGLRSHPKVVRMSSALKADKFRIVGGLHAVWAVFDQHSPDGVLEGYTFRTMDEEIGWRGFSGAMGAVEWLEQTEAGLTVPRFDEHNGASAKRRAMEAERKRLARLSEVGPQSGGTDGGTESGQASASDADKKRTREEKSVTTSSEKAGGGGRAAPPPCPHREIVDLYHEILPEHRRVELLNDHREGLVRARWRQLWVEKGKRGKPNDRESLLASFRGYFAYVGESAFLTGRAPSTNGRPPFVADFEWLMGPENFAKVVEKKYHTPA